MPHRLPLPSLLFAAGLMSTAAPAQRAGLWETRTEMAGRTVGSAGRECMPADMPRRAMTRWPAGCTVTGPAETGSGTVVEALCRSGGATLAIRRELIENGDSDYAIRTTSRIDRAGAAPQILPDAMLRARYAGGCSDPSDGANPGRNEGQPRTGRPAIFWILQIVAFAGFLYLSIRGGNWAIRRLARTRYAQATVANITTDRAGSAQIPVLATFWGVRGLPWWYAVAMNNANPSLVIAADGIGFRVIRRRRRSWYEIECIDIRQAMATVNFDVTFHGALLTFSANLGSVPLAAHVLSLLPASVPLSDRALAVRAGSS